MNEVEKMRSGQLADMSVLEMQVRFERAKKLLARMRIVSGDIFIDVETVADNARRYGATRLCEMRRVVVHGVLHLCGQGDKTPRTNRQMHRKEDKYLKFWDEKHPAGS